MPRAGSSGSDSDERKDMSVIGNRAERGGERTFCTRDIITRMNITVAITGINNKQITITITSGV